MYACRFCRMGFPSLTEAIIHENRSCDRAPAASRRAPERSAAEARALFRQDLPSIVLLVIMYSFQGLTWGFFMSSVPLIFKQYLTYGELGALLRCTLPFSLKLLWSPFVEIYHFKSFGRRKSWVIPTQLAMCVVFLYLKDNIETLLAEKHVNFTTAVLTFLVVTMTCQDIAVDSWAVEMLHPANNSYGSSSQSMGIALGAFVSSSVFIALNSPEFCQ